MNRIFHHTIYIYFLDLLYQYILNNQVFPLGIVKWFHRLFRQKLLVFLHHHHQYRQFIWLLHHLFLHFPYHFHIKLDANHRAQSS